MRFLGLALSKVIGKAGRASKLSPIFRLHSPSLFLLHSVPHSRQVQGNLPIFPLPDLPSQLKLSLIDLMLLKAILGHFLIEHMAEQPIIHPHLIALFDLDNVEQASIDDKGVIVPASVEAGFLGLMKDLAVNG